MARRYVQAVVLDNEGYEGRLGPVGSVVTLDLNTYEQVHGIEADHSLIRVKGVDFANWIGRFGIDPLFKGRRN